jgi:predicted DNA binding CopG/RHH family protein
MRKEYDFSRGKRGAVIPATGKTRISIYVNDEVLQRLRTEAEKAGTGYQTLINEALKIRYGLTKKLG